MDVTRYDVTSGWPRGVRDACFRLLTELDSTSAALTTLAGTSRTASPITGRETGPMSANIGRAAQHRHQPQTPTSRWRSGWVANQLTALDFPESAGRVPDRPADQRTTADHVVATLSKRASAPPRGTGLPVAELHTATRDQSVCYGFSTMDARGRLANRSPLRALAWEPGQRLAMSPANDYVVAAPCRTGTAAITRQGHIRVPAEVRHCLELQAGAQLFMVAYVPYALIVLYPLHALDAMLRAYHSPLRHER